MLSNLSVINHQSITRKYVDIVQTQFLQTEISTVFVPVSLAHFGLTISNIFKFFYFLILCNEVIDFRAFRQPHC